MTSTQYNNRDEQLDALEAAITNRRAFTYNAAADPLYRSQADSYVQNGRLAMRDTMGQAASLTGGYGSTYSQRVGQQQYNEYMRSLSQLMPELYSLAYKRYTDQGAALQNAYDMAYERSERDYQRRRDAAADAAALEQQQYQRSQNSYKSLSALISSTGYKPGDEELSAAGMSRAQAEALRGEYLRKNSSGSSSGGRSSSRRSGSTGAYVPAGAVAGALLGLSGVRR